MNRRRLTLVGGTLVILCSFGYLAWGGIGDNLVYFLTPSELLARGAQGQGEPVRLGGEVKPGSVRWDAQALDLRFRITDGTREVEVHSKGAPPQMFSDGIGVVVEGSYNQAGVFESTNLMVKHSNEYRPPDHGAKPEQIYGELPRRDALPSKTGN